MNKAGGQWIYLSYQLCKETPGYGGEKSFIIKSVKSIEKGDSCNSSYWCFSNHIGTHIDLPKHFEKNGLTDSNFHPDFWNIRHPFLIDLSPVKPDTIISLTDYDFNHIPIESDMLLFKTGFCKFRNEAIYWKNNPGISPQLAFIFREKFPNLKMIGLDSISVSSYSQRDIGREAHRAFLNHKRPILLLEDMDLTKVGGKTVFEDIIIAPLRVENSDAAPCTVFAEINK